MLSDVEFAAEIGLENCDDITPEMGEFSWFTLPLADGTPLWRVKQSSKKQRQQIAQAEHEAARQAKLAMYVARGYAFDERAK